VDLASLSPSRRSDQPILVEGVTLWLSALVGDDLDDPDPIVDGPMSDARGDSAHRCPVVVVAADRSRHGPIPGSRAFRDLVGWSISGSRPCRRVTSWCRVAAHAQAVGASVNREAADHRAIAAALDAIDSLGPLDATAMAAAATHLDRLTKPPGSLGRLEELLIDLAGITARADAPVARRWIVVAAGDHGVATEGVSAYPAEVTAQMVTNFVAGGAAINVLASAAGASLAVVDVGVASPIEGVLPDGHGHGNGHDPRAGGRLLHARIADGTANMTLGPAMDRAETLRAVGSGSGHQ
jgi:hypothetical protein